MFKKGDKIDHKDYGTGVVWSVNPEGISQRKGINKKVPNKNIRNFYINECKFLILRLLRLFTRTTFWCIFYYRFSYWTLC
jgi:hypothetical protein